MDEVFSAYSEDSRTVPQRIERAKASHPWASITVSSLAPMSGFTNLQTPGYRCPLQRNATKFSQTGRARV